MSPIRKPSDERAPRASVFASSDTVIVKVGKQFKTYTLHKKLLTFHSGFFRGALSADHKESSEGVVILEAIGIGEFEIFVEWLYEKTLPCCIMQSGPNPMDIQLASRAYVVADMLIACGMKEALFHELYQVYTLSRSRKHISRIVNLCKHLSENDVMIQLLVDCFCVYGGLGHLTKECIKQLSELPKETLVRILLKQNELQNLKREEWRVRREDYVFEHGDRISTNELSIAVGVKER
ncbi:hypothetical protein LEMA_P047260.1 [Plenodomus lingam JN3]|uniref:BTB domain-containing protein n=1 Tax=Leptosphaeria maculans (strain JN3 / isolate v23.1.3 / race Av1-4-5-6-7-8) TaxID=985895 RepID=E5R550_LEPMJ|nr:hypothetical protein LEMA_P047260.1 [Plenodomus lingam JN3]CBX92020.1 hypothetical protein LEMA_P047260.1 [Plenodomus lingam JN3]